MNIRIFGDTVILKLSNSDKPVIFNSRHLLDIEEHNENWHENSSGYIQAHSKINKQSIFIHRIITGFKRVDHKDRNPFNNLDSNLRKTTRSQNICNVKRDNKSGLRGVVWNKIHNRYESFISFKGKKLFLGGFSDKIEAAKVYDKKALELHGEFAILNFPIVQEPESF